MTFTTMMVALLCLLASEIFAKQPSPILQIRENSTELDAESVASILLTTTNTAFEDILAGHYQDQFKPLQRERKTLGFTDQAIWIRFQLQNTLSTDVRTYLEVNYPNLDYVDFYIAYHDHMQIVKSGDQRPFRERDIPFRNPMTRINLKTGEQATVFVRIQGQGSIYVNLKLRKESDYLNYRLWDERVISAFLAMTAIIFWYNLFLFFAAREPIYALYCAYLLLVTFMQVNALGVIVPWLFPDNPRAINVSALLGITLANFGSVMFSYYFLSIRNKSLYLKWGFRCYLTYCSLLVLGSFFASYNRLIQVATPTFVVTSLAMIIVGLIMYLRGFKPALYFLLAFSSFFAFAILRGLSNSGFVEASFFSEWGIIIGGTLEVFFLAISLAQRFRDIKHDELVAKLKAMELQSSLESARLVQQTLLPEENLPDSIQIASYYRSADLAGGDWFYHFYDTPRKRLYLFVGDVTGHGISSAMLTAAVAGATVSHLLGFRSKEQQLSPGDELTQLAENLNHIIHDSGRKASRLMTMALYCIDMETRTLTYLNAGHNSFAIINAQATKEYLRPGSILGLSLEPVFMTMELTLNKDEILLVFTDGLLENTGLDKRRIPWKNLTKELPQYRSPDALKAHLVNAIETYWTGASIDDDCTFVILQCG